MSLAKNLGQHIGQNKTIYMIATFLTVLAMVSVIGVILIVKDDSKPASQPAPKPASTSSTSSAFDPDAKALVEALVGTVAALAAAEGSFNKPPIAMVRTPSWTGVGSAIQIHNTGPGHLAGVQFQTRMWNSSRAIGTGWRSVGSIFAGHYIQLDNSGLGAYDPLPIGPGMVVDVFVPGFEVVTFSF